MENTDKTKKISLYNLFWIFYLGCLAGVIVETIWCICTNGYFEYRTALILEPLNPVYGFGAVLISICFHKAQGWKNIFIFAGSFIIGGLFEALCSLFQEYVFGTVSWMYSKTNFAILGRRTSLLYCLFWGLLGIVWVRVIYPTLLKLIAKIPKKISSVLTWFLVVLFSIDVLFSCGALLRQKERRNDIPATNIIDTFYDTHLNDEKLKFFYHNMKTRDDINYE